MGYKELSIDDIKHSSSFGYKGRLARKGCVFFLFKVKHNGMKHEYAKEVDKEGSTKEQQEDYILSAKQQIFNQLNK